MQPFIPENCLTEQLEWGKKQISLREIHSQESNTFFQFFFFFSFNDESDVSLGTGFRSSNTYKKKVRWRNFLKVEQEEVGIEGEWQKKPDTRVLSNSLLQ